MKAARTDRRNEGSRTARTAVALTLAVLWGAVPLAPLLHEGHAHRLCAVHGVIEESGEQSVLRDAARRAPEGWTVRPAQQSVHDEATFGFAPRLPVGSAPSTAGRAAALEATCAGASSPAHVALAPLTVAPKGSPPRA